MGRKEEYLSLITEIIQKQTVILGPDIAVLKARSVPVLVLDKQGQVVDIKGDMNQALRMLIDQYVELSGLIVKNALGSIFTKYPTIKQVE